jgi:hypothetical protein
MQGQLTVRCARSLPTSNLSSTGITLEGEHSTPPPAGTVPDAEAQLDRSLDGQGNGNDDDGCQPGYHSVSSRMMARGEEARKLV